MVALQAADCSFSGPWLKLPRSEGGVKSPQGGAPGGKQDECHVAAELKTQQRRNTWSSRSQGSDLSTISNLFPLLHVKVPDGCKRPLPAPSHVSLLTSFKNRQRRGEMIVTGNLK